ncbi:MAG: hypothetical protein U1D55_02545 [Phycisphaerae bacterium]
MVLLDSVLVITPATRKVHRAFCESLSHAKQKEQYRGTVRKALSDGFVPCARCRPEARLLGSPKSRIVHVEELCAAVRKMRNKNLVLESFTSALDKGFEICSYCRRQLPGIWSLLESRLPERRALKSLIDAYSRIAWIEISLSYAVRRVLVDAFGDEWWREGVPLEVRKSCQTRREDAENSHISDPYRCVNFIDLKDIIDKKWKWFGEKLPKDLACNRNELLRRVVELNALRNRVMHPAKNADIENFECGDALSSFEEQLDLARWRL